MKTKLVSIALAISALAGPALAAAQPETVALKGEVHLEKTVVENGASHIVVSEPKVVVPGDKLVFSTAYRNTGAQPVTNFVVTNALPPAVQLAGESVAGAQVSVDGGKTWGALGDSTMADGKGGKRPATAADVTHLRWTIPAIAPGGSGNVEYRATVR